MLSIDDYEQGKIPSLEDFEIVSELFQKYFQTYPNRLISLALYGSFIGNNHSHSSDLDCFYIPQNPQDLIAFGNLIRKIFNEYYIDVEANPLNPELSKMGHHTIIPCFNQHINIAMNSKHKMILGENPLNYIGDLSIKDISDVKNSAKHGLVFRTWQLAKKSFWKTLEQKGGLLETILESPYHVARLSLQYHNPTLFEQKGIKDNKRNVVKLYENNGGQNFQFLKNIFELRMRYNQLLKERKEKGITNKTEYIQLLNDVENQFLPFYEFCRTNLRTMQ